jgi:hypothetical protein
VCTTYRHGCISLPKPHSRLNFLDFSLDKLPIEVQWREKRSRGCPVLEMKVGAFVALFFLGLPLAIIGLFIASTLDRRNSRPPEGFTASQEPAASTSAMDYAGDKRRIVYGRYSVVTTATAERYELTRAHGRRV